MCLKFTLHLDSIHCSTKLNIWAGAALQSEAALIANYGREQTDYRYDHTSKNTNYPFKATVICSL